MSANARARARARTRVRARGEGKYSSVIEARKTAGSSELIVARGRRAAVASSPAALAAACARCSRARGCSRHSLPDQPSVAREEVGQHSNVTPAAEVPRTLSNASATAAGDGVTSPPIADSARARSKAAVTAAYLDEGEGESEGVEEA